MDSVNYFTEPSEPLTPKVFSCLCDAYRDAIAAQGETLDTVTLLRHTATLGERFAETLASVSGFVLGAVATMRTTDDEAQIEDIANALTLLSQTARRLPISANPAVVTMALPAEDARMRLMLCIGDVARAAQQAQKMPTMLGALDRIEEFVRSAVATFDNADLLAIELGLLNAEEQPEAVYVALGRWAAAVIRIVKALRRLDLAIQRAHAILYAPMEG